MQHFENGIFFIFKKGLRLKITGRKNRPSGQRCEEYGGIFTGNKVDLIYCLNEKSRLECYLFFMKFPLLYNNIYHSIYITFGRSVWRYFLVHLMSKFHTGLPANLISKSLNAVGWVRTRFSQFCTDGVNAKVVGVNGNEAHGAWITEEMEEMH